MKFKLDTLSESLFQSQEENNVQKVSSILTLETELVHKFHFHLGDILVVNWSHSETIPSRRQPI